MNLLKLYTETKDSIIELLYPRLCYVCESRLIKGEKYICTNCLYHFPFVYMGDMHQERLINKLMQTPALITAHSLFYYDKNSPYKNLIHAIKYQYIPQLAHYLGAMFADKVLDNAHIDYIIPIPLHKKKQRKRGFNQSHEIALGINTTLHTEIIEDALIRIINNKSQTNKSYSERQANVSSAFILNNKYIDKLTDKTVLLVDDVITTGATTNACIACLILVPNIKIQAACLAQTI